MMKELKQNISPKDAITINAYEIKDLKIVFEERDDISYEIDGDLSEYHDEESKYHLEIWACLKRKTWNDDIKRVKKGPVIDSLYLYCPVSMTRRLTLNLVTSKTLIKGTGQGHIDVNSADMDLSLDNIDASINIKTVNLNFRADKIKGQLTVNSVNSSLGLYDLVSYLELKVNGVRSNIFIQEKEEFNYDLKASGVNTSIRYHGSKNSALGSTHVKSQTKTSYDPNKDDVRVRANGVDMSIVVE